MKKIIILTLLLFSLSSASFGKGTTFTNEVFKDAQISGKTVVINSWNKTCGTCAKQVIILNKAKKEMIKQDQFDKIIINDDLNKSKQKVFQMVIEFLI